MMNVNVNLQVILEQALEAGARRGIRRMFKHHDDPPSEAEMESLCAFVVEAQMQAVQEVIEFPEWWSGPPSDGDLGA